MLGGKGGVASDGASKLGDPESKAASARNLGKVPMSNLGTRVSTQNILSHDQSLPSQGSVSGRTAALNRDGSREFSERRATKYGNKPSTTNQALPAQGNLSQSHNQFHSRRFRIQA